MWWVVLDTTIRAVLMWIWLICKPILGWFFIIIGLIGMPMPIVNGLIFLVIGIALVGPLGRLALSSARQVSRQHRRMHWWWLARRARRLAA